MSFFRRKFWGRIKPQVGSLLDYTDPINAQLYSYWLCNDLSAVSNIRNLVGRPAGSINSGVTWVPGNFGYAMKFDGSTGRTNFGTDAAYNKTSGFQAFSLWFKSNTLAGAQVIFSMGGGGTATTGGWGFQLNGTTGTLTLYYKNGVTTTQQSWSTSGTDYGNGRWHHVVCSFCFDTTTQANNAASLCVDGIEVTFTRTDVGLPQTLSGASLRLGCREGAIGTLSAFFAGQIENVRWYTRALNDGEANRLFMEPFAGVAPPDGFYIRSSAGATDNPLNAPLGQLTLSGLVPTLTQGNSLTAPLGQLTLNGLVPTFAQGSTLVAPLGTLTLNGLIPTLTQGNSLTAPLGTLTLGGLDATFLQTGPVTITAPLGTLTLQGLDASFVQSGQVFQPYNLTGSGGGRRLHKEVEQLQYVREIEKKLKQGVGIREAIQQLKESPKPEVRQEAARLARKPAEKIQKSAKTVSRIAELLRREIPDDNISGQVADNLDAYIKAYVDDEDAVIAKVVELTARIIGA